MIAGRPAALWVGMLQAAINLVSLGYVAFTGSPLTPEQTQFFIGANALAAAFVAVLANQAVTGSYLGASKSASAAKK